MKRLVGGDLQLDLSPIEIEESVDGATYTSITDKSVLDQLTDLKSFIGKSGMMKTVWVKLLNGETDELIVTRGSLSTSDGVTFLIKVLFVGFILTLSVEFTQAETEDHTPLDEWYIDSGDAKYILISEAQEIGAISELPVFENIVDKDGHKRFVEGDIEGVTTEGITQTYGKWSLSGTHLMIVVALTIADETVISNTQALAEKITLPSWILDKLVPVYATRIDTKNFYAFASNYTQQTLGAYIDKASDGIVIRKDQAMTLTAERSVRIQFDFLIDNEETPAP